MRPLTECRQDDEMSLPDRRWRPSGEPVDERLGRHLGDREDSRYRRSGQDPGGGMRGRGPGARPTSHPGAMAGPGDSRGHPGPGVVTPPPPSDHLRLDHAHRSRVTGPAGHVCRTRAGGLVAAFSGWTREAAARQPDDIPSWATFKSRRVPSWRCPHPLAGQQIRYCPWVRDKLARFLPWKLGYDVRGAVGAPLPEQGVEEREAVYSRSSPRPSWPWPARRHDLRKLGRRPAGGRGSR